MNNNDKGATWLKRHSRCVIELWTKFVTTCSVESDVSATLRQCSILSLCHAPNSRRNVQRRSAVRYRWHELAFPNSQGGGLRLCRYTNFNSVRTAFLYYVIHFCKMLESCRETSTIVKIVRKDFAWYEASSLLQGSSYSSLTGRNDAIDRDCK